MKFTNPKSLKDLDNVVLLDTLLRGLKNEQDSITLRKLFKETINTHYRLFENKTKLLIIICTPIPITINPIILERAKIPD